MAQKDKERWNEKYLDKNIAQKLSTATKIVQEYAKESRGKQALDIACGIGRHSKYLVSQGFSIDALDVSSVAIEQLQGLKNIHAQEVDFDSHTLEKEKYDLIVCTYYPERKLLPQMIAGLNKDGIIIFETFVHDTSNKSSPSNPKFLLKKDELKNYFSKDCELLVMKEWIDIDYKGNESSKASMVARKRINQA